MPRSLALLLFVVVAGGCGDAPVAQAPQTAFERVAVAEVPWARLSPAQVDEAAQMGVPPAFENAWGMRFVYVPHGAFPMGSPEDEPGRAADEAPHEVRLRAGYFMQVQAITVSQLLKWPTGRDLLPDAAPDASGPAGYLSHDKAGALAAWLSGQDEMWSYRLPTEAEWEYACRAGSATAYASGPAHAPLADGNAWGLRGMHVGIREWCQDHFGELASWTVQDPIGPNEGDSYVVRGGGSAAEPRRSAARAAVVGDTRVADLGARLVVPVGYGLGRYGSIDVSFRLEDRLAEPGDSPPSGGLDLRIISMNDRLTARTARVDAVWARVSMPNSPLTLTMVPGKYYVYSEARGGKELARGLEIKFQVWDRPVEVPVPIPEKDMRRYGSGGHEKPQ